MAHPSGVLIDLIQEQDAVPAPDLLAQCGGPAAGHPSPARARRIHSQERQAQGPGEADLGATGEGLECHLNSFEFVDRLVPHAWQPHTGGGNSDLPNLYPAIARQKEKSCPSGRTKKNLGPLESPPHLRCQGTAGCWLLLHLPGFHLSLPSK